MRATALWVFVGLVAILALADCVLVKAILWVIVAVAVWVLVFVTAILDIAP